MQIYIGAFNQSLSYGIILCTRISPSKSLNSHADSFLFLNWILAMCVNK